MMPSVSCSSSHLLSIFLSVLYFLLTILHFFSSLLLLSSHLSYPRPLFFVCLHFPQLLILYTSSATHLESSGVKKAGHLLLYTSVVAWQAWMLHYAVPVLCITLLGTGENSYRQQPPAGTWYLVLLWYICWKTWTAREAEGCVVLPTQLSRLERHTYQLVKGT